MSNSRAAERQELVQLMCSLAAGSRKEARTPMVQKAGK